MHGVLRWLSGSGWTSRGGEGEARKGLNVWGCRSTRRAEGAGQGRLAELIRERGLQAGRWVREGLVSKSLAPEVDRCKGRFGQGVVAAARCIS